MLKLDETGKRLTKGEKSQLFRDSTMQKDFLLLILVSNNISNEAGFIFNHTPPLKKLAEKKGKDQRT